MSIREVTKAPAEYEGMARNQDGAVILHETLTNLGWTIEIIKHEDTYYVVNRSARASVVAGTTSSRSSTTSGRCVSPRTMRTR